MNPMSTVYSGSGDVSPGIDLVDANVRDSSWNDVIVFQTLTAGICDNYEFNLLQQISVHLVIITLWSSHQTPILLWTGQSYD